MRRLWLPAILSCAAVSPVLAAEPWAGRPLVDVLREAEHAGIRVIFTDRLVPAGLRVKRNPVSSDPVEALKEALLPNALTLSELSPGIYVVTRSKPDAPVTHITELTEEVQVTASRYTFENSPLRDNYALESTDLEQQPGMLNDASLSIRRFPGTAGQSLSSRTFVRGGTDEENLILLDGVPLYDPVHLQGLPVNFSVIDPSLLGRVDFYSGVLPIEHDGRLSALVDMHLREPVNDFSGRMSLGNLDASATLSGRLPDERGSWLLFTRRGLMGRITQPVEPSIGKPAVLDVLGRVRYRIDSGSELTVGVLTAYDHAHFQRYAGFAGGLEATDDEISRNYLWTVYDKRSERLVSRTLLTHTTINTQQIGALQDFDTGWSGALDQERRFQATLLKQDWTLPLDGLDSLRWGVGVEHQQANIRFLRNLNLPDTIAELYNRPARESSSIHTTPSLWEYEAYVGFNETLNPRLTLEGGLHWTHAAYSTGQTSSVGSPRIGLRFDVFRSTRARLSWGRMSQSQSAVSLPVERDQLLFDQHAVNTMTVLALEHDFASGFFVRAERFRKKIDAPQPRIETVFSPDPVLPELRPDAQVIAPGSSLIQGWDLYATARFSARYSAWLSYSFSRANDMLRGIETPRAWDQPHAGNLGFAMSIGGWQASAMYSMHSSWPLTPLYDTSVLRPGGPFPQSIGWKNSMRESVYFKTLDIRMARSIQLGPGALQVALEVTNVLDRKNSCCDEVDYQQQDRGVYNTLHRQYWQPRRTYASLVWEF